MKKRDGYRVLWFQLATSYTAISALISATEEKEKEKRGRK